MNTFVQNPLANTLEGVSEDANIPTNEELLEKLAAPYIRTGMDQERARWAAALEMEKSKQREMYDPTPGINARPDMPHRAWGDVQTGVAGAGLAAAPWTAGISVPVAGAVNAGIMGLKKIFG